MSYSKYLEIKGKPNQREIKIGIAIPCHESDIELLKYCLGSIEKLNPQPFLTLVDINKGKTMKEVVTGLFDKLFAGGCDVVLRVDADFYLFPNILRFVKRDRVISYAPFYKKVYILTLATVSLIFRNGWSGCYSVPRGVWFGFLKGKFDGTDSSVRRALGKFNYDFKSSFGYMILRPYREASTRNLVHQFPLWKRILWQIVRLKAVR